MKVLSLEARRVIRPHNSLKRRYFWAATHTYFPQTQKRTDPSSPSTKLFLNTKNEKEMMSVYKECYSTFTLEEHSIFLSKLLRHINNPSDISQFHLEFPDFNKILKEIHFSDPNPTIDSICSILRSTILLCKQQPPFFNKAIHHLLHNTRATTLKNKISLLQTLSLLSFRTPPTEELILATLNQIRSIIKNHIRSTSHSQSSSLSSTPLLPSPASSKECLQILKLFATYNYKPESTYSFLIDNLLPSELSFHGTYSLLLSLRKLNVIHEDLALTITERLQSLSFFSPQCIPPEQIAIFIHNLASLQEAPLFPSSPSDPLYFIIGEIEKGLDKHSMLVIRQWLRLLLRMTADDFEALERKSALENRLIDLLMSNEFDFAWSIDIAQMLMRFFYQISLLYQKLHKNQNIFHQHQKLLSHSLQQLVKNLSLERISTQNLFSFFEHSDMVKRMFYSPKSTQGNVLEQIFQELLQRELFHIKNSQLFSLINALHVTKQHETNRELYSKLIDPILSQIALRPPQDLSISLLLDFAQFSLPHLPEFIPSPSIMKSLRSGDHSNSLLLDEKEKQLDWIVFIHNQILHKRCVREGKISKDILHKEFSPHYFPALTSFIEFLALYKKQYQFDEKLDAFAHRVVHHLLHENFRNESQALGNSRDNERSTADVEELLGKEKVLRQGGELRRLEKSYEAQDILQLLFQGDKYLWERFYQGDANQIRTVRNLVENLFVREGGDLKESIKAIQLLELQNVTLTHPKFKDTIFQCYLHAQPMLSLMSFTYLSKYLLKEGMNNERRAIIRKLLASRFDDVKRFHPHEEGVTHNEGEKTIFDFIFAHTLLLMEQDVPFNTCDTLWELLHIYLEYLHFFKYDCLTDDSLTDKDIEDRQQMTIVLDDFFPEKNTKEEIVYHRYKEKLLEMASSNIFQPRAFQGSEKLNRNFSKRNRLLRHQQGVVLKKTREEQVLHKLLSSNKLMHMTPQIMCQNRVKVNSHLLMDNIAIVIREGDVDDLMSLWKRKLLENQDRNLKVIICDSDKIHKGKVDILKEIQAK